LYKGSPNSQIETWDISAACTSGLCAVVDVERALRCEPDYQYGLAVGSEVIASRMNPFKSLSDNLWGCGAGAALLEKTDNPNKGIICSIFSSDPKGEPMTRSIGLGTRMEDKDAERKIYFAGNETQKFILRIIPKLITDLIAKANRIFESQGKRLVSVDDIDLIVPHQPNSKAFDRPAATLGISKEKFFINIETLGNTSSAAWMIALAEAWEQGLITPGRLVVILAFGGGIIDGAMLVQF
jgi:3-oxoacyl-[acyl-carrier-protein] synthase-3